MSIMTRRYKNEHRSDQEGECADETLLTRRNKSKEEDRRKEETDRQTHKKREEGRRTTKGRSFT